ncbi:hypothetical protein MMC12_008473 [Toensbergia leucococca]|nr:hypothetical protein [Toensbergia leucococca]
MSTSIRELATELLDKVFHDSIIQWTRNEKEYENIQSYQLVCRHWREFLQDRILADMRKQNPEDLQDCFMVFVKLRKWWAIKQVLTLHQCIGNAASWHSAFNQALQVSVTTEHKSMTQMLLARGADVNSRSNFEETLLHSAIRKGNETITTLLLERDADVHARSCGIPPLFAAAQFGNANLIKLLLKKGANIEIEYHGYTALSRALFQGYEDVIRLLLNMGAGVKTRDHKEPMLHRAIINRPIIPTLLLEKGADVNARTTDEATALHRAVQAGRQAIVKLLLEWGAKTDVKDSEGRVPLHYVTNWGQVPVTQLLLDYGADIEATNMSDQTLLHLVVIGNPYLHFSDVLNMVRFLVKRGASVQARDGDGESVIDRAVDRAGVFQQDDGFFREKLRDLLLTSQHSKPGEATWEEAWEPAWQLAERSRRDKKLVLALDRCMYWKDEEEEWL